MGRPNRGADDDEDDGSQQVQRSLADDGGSNIKAPSYDDDDDDIEENKIKNDGVAAGGLSPPQDTDAHKEWNGDGQQQQQQAGKGEAYEGQTTGGDEQALDAYVVDPNSKKKKQEKILQPEELLEGEVVRDNNSNNNSRMSTRTIILLIFVGGVILFAVVAVSVYFALKEEEDVTVPAPPTPPLVVVEVESVSPAPTSAPTTGAPSLEPSVSLEPSSAPTGLPTTADFAVFSLLLDLVYDLFYEGLELDLTDSNGPVARASVWMTEEDIWLRNLANSGMELDVGVLFEFLERFSLAVFYFATGGETWNLQCNFLSPALHVCDWNCPIPDEVLEASINNEFNDQDLSDLIGLGGSSTMGVQCVKDLVTDTTGAEDLLDSVLSLRLVFNGLRGFIPRELSQGIQVAFDFNFAFNELTGTIPWEDFGGALFQFIAPGNQFGGSLPPGFGRFTNLETVQLGSNSLTGSIPDEVATMTTLALLYLDNNLLEGTIPSGLAAIIPNIDFLFLENNMLTGTLPAFPFDSPGSFNLADNNITGTFPDLPARNIFNPYRFEGFDVRNNSMTGTLPDSIGFLTNLDAVSLADNQFSGTIPDSFRSLTNLEILRLDGNQFTGKILEGDIFANMRSMLFWLMINNDFSGTISGDYITQLPVLETFLVSRNSFTGTIPSEVGNMLGLVDLHLDDNDLTGPIPATIANLGRLQTLALNLNSLTGNLETNCVQAQALLDSGQTFVQVFNFTADCPEEVICPCCTICCDANNVCGINGG